MLTPVGPLTLLVAGVTLLVGLLVAARLVVAPAVTTGLLVVVVVSDVSSVAGKAGPASVYLLTLALAVVTLAVAVHRGTIRLHWSPFFLLAGIWLATRALSVLWAGDVAAGTTELVDEAKGVVLFVVLTILLASIRRQVWIIGLAVATMAAFSALTLVQEFVLGDSTSFGGLSGISVASEVAGLGARHSGTQGDPNFWGRLLVMFLPLALALLWGRGGSEPHVQSRTLLGAASPRWWLLAVAALIGGEYLTQSRGGLIAALVTVVLTLALMVRNRVRLVTGGVALVLALALLPGVGSRLSSLASLNAPAATGVVDQSLLGREAAQQAGLAMFRDSPLVGVGAGNFEVSGRSYQRKLGLAALSVRNGQLLAPHDLYVQMAAEGGVVGLVGWLVFYLGSLVLVFRARRRWRHLNGGSDGVEARLCAAVAAALAGWGVASLFLHLANLPVFMVIVAFGAALHLRARIALAARSPQAPDGDPSPVALQTAFPSRDIQPDLRPSSARRTTLIVLALALLGGSALVARPAATSRVGWSSTAVINVAPTHSKGVGSLGYAYAVLSRTQIMPTLVVLATSPVFVDEAARSVGMSARERQGLALTAVRPPGASTFRLTVTIGNANHVAPLVTSTVDRLRGYLTAQGSLYSVRITSRSGTVRVGTERNFDIAIAVLLAVLGVLALVTAARERSTRPPSRRGRGRHAQAPARRRRAGAADGLHPVSLHAAT